MMIARRLDRLDTKHDASLVAAEMLLGALQKPFLRFAFDHAIWNRARKYSFSPDARSATKLMPNPLPDGADHESARLYQP